MYVDEPAGSIKVDKLPVVWTVALAVCIIGIVLLGVVYSPWYNFITLAAMGL
jgi:hypothetical protein